MRIISIGNLCATAAFLRTNKARDCTYCFDWARSNILSVIDVINNGHDFHIKNNIIAENQNTLIAHKYTNKRFSHIIYPHNNYKIDRNYLIRCSERFFKTLNSNEEIKFLYMSDNGHSIELDELDILIKSIKEHYPELNFEIIIIVNNKLEFVRQVYLESENKYYKIYKCQAPKPFVNNPMTDDKFYYDLFNFIFLDFVKINQDCNDIIR